MMLIVSLLVIPGALAGEEQQARKSPTIHETLSAGAPSLEAIAGYIFGVPVPAGNYDFAKRVSYMFPRPWEESLTGAEREQAIWEALILHYESFRRNVTVSDEELTKRIDSVLQSQQSFTKTGDPEAYARWIKEKLGESVEQFENQMRYLSQVDKLKDQVRESTAVTVTEEEMQQEFLNEQHHLGREADTFETKHAAEAFDEQRDAYYQQIKTKKQDEALKKWIEDLKTSAQLKVLPPPEPAATSP